MHGRGNQVKVAQVIPGLPSSSGGPAVMVVELTRALGRCGVESAIYTTTLASPAQVAGGRRIEPQELPPGSDELDIRFFPARWPYRLAFSPGLDRGLAREISRYDVVHIHSLFLFPQFSAYRHAHTQDIPYIVSQHGSLDPYMRGRGHVRKWLTDIVWQRRMLERAAGLHVASVGEATSVEDIAPGVPRVFAPFGIHSGEFDRLPPADVFRRRYLAGAKGPLVVNLGRLTEKKRPDILVRAFSLVVRQLPDARLALVGPDDEEMKPALIALAQSEGVADRIIFPGLLVGEEKLAALGAADAWALPSKSEGFPMAVLEALAAGLPSVITPFVNNAADIEQAQAALVCEPAPAAFADKLLTILTDSHRAALLGRRAREFARQYDWDLVGPRWVELYEGVARSHTNRT